MERRKFPRTPHVKWSPGVGDDDRVADRAHRLAGSDDVVVTLKLDGENTTIYPDGTCHARSLDSRGHPSRTWVRRYAATLGPRLDPRWRICGENLYATHSIHYTALASYFYGFALVEDDHVVDWDLTVAIFDDLNIVGAPTIYRGPYDRGAIDAAYAPHAPIHEGWVARPAAGFAFADYPDHVAKWVRAGHVQTGQHWAHQPVRPNQLGH